MDAMRLCFLIFCLFLASVSSIRKLNNIDDLKNVDYGKSAPRHGLQLLFWFAQEVVDVDHNNVLGLNSNFDPHRGDFGFHRYLNKEGILPSLSSLQSYYSVGNLKSPGAKALPAYVQRYYRNTNVPQRNMDRLIVSMIQNNPNRMFRNDFNLSDTYEIDPALILQIRHPYNCTLDQNNNYGIYKEDQRCRQFLIQTGYNSTECTHRDTSRRKKRSPSAHCITYEGVKLEIKASTQGYSKLVWEIPAYIIENSKYVHIDICQNTHSSDTSEVHALVRKQYFCLQPRLRLYTSLFNYHFTEPYIWYGPEFDGANRAIPTRIKGFDASLQLYAEDGKACARLYIEKTFSKWEDVLYHSWVGFYKSSQDENDDYYTYKYAVKFPKINNYITDNYDVYQYNSSLAMAPGVQIRFLLDKKYNNVLAQTTPWEDVEELTILPSDCGTPNPGLQPKLSSPWSEFFYGPGFYDANKVIPIKIPKFDAGLQLFTEDGKACTRLYIKKTFRNWKNTFYYSWVGFYTSSQKNNEAYDAYQYVVNFKKMMDGTKNFDIYQHKSNLAIAPGVQIRFLMDKGYDKLLVQTEPWKSG
ncbi:hypothetical protein ABG768_013478 [Culter alburnus]|uniref:Uncharacterized protein n=1 Tax=Culter alburnus TaxID=194366 RepID=A0AAW2B4E9_CULAL